MTPVLFSESGVATAASSRLRRDIEALGFAEYPYGGLPIGLPEFAELEEYLEDPSSRRRAYRGCLNILNNFHLLFPHNGGTNTSIMLGKEFKTVHPASDGWYRQLIDTPLAEAPHHERDLTAGHDHSELWLRMTPKEFWETIDGVAARSCFAPDFREAITTRTFAADYTLRTDWFGPVLIIYCALRQTGFTRDDLAA